MDDERPEIQKSVRVYINSIEEYGVITKIWADDHGEKLINVRRDNDNLIHLCRLCELTALPWREQCIGELK